MAFLGTWAHRWLLFSCCRPTPPDPFSAQPSSHCPGAMHGVVVTEAQDPALGPAESHPIGLSLSVSLPRSLSRTIPSPSGGPLSPNSLSPANLMRERSAPSPTSSTATLNSTGRSTDGRVPRPAAPPAPHSPTARAPSPPRPRRRTAGSAHRPPRPGPPSGTAAPAGPPPSHLRGHRRLLVLLHPRPGSERRGTASAPARSGRHFVSSLGSDVGGRPAGSTPAAGPPLERGRPRCPPAPRFAPMFTRERLGSSHLPEPSSAPRPPASALIPRQWAVEESRFSFPIMGFWWCSFVSFRFVFKQK